MSYKIEKVPKGSVTTPKGFTAGGLHCGIKKSEKFDLGILCSQVRCRASGVFTTNQLKGASLLVTRDALQDGGAQAILVTSGNANACTGERGLLDAREMSRTLARELQIPLLDVLPNSTGVIGEYLPLPNIRDGIKTLIPQISEDGGLDFAKAILTTDTVIKNSARKVTVDGHQFSLGGVAKGAGMIHPNMATMFVFITTDARLSSESLHIFLMETVEKTFNRLTIDGDTSCCDTMLIFSNGLADSTEIDVTGSPLSDAFRDALDDLCLDLVYQLAADGEGVSKVATIRVKGCAKKNDAFNIAKTIAVSPLVKTAIHGEDPNWGRLLTAAGYAGVSFQPQQCSLWIGDILVMKNGQRTDYEEDQAHHEMKNPNYDIILDINQGEYQDYYITTDLSKEYIDINADYRHRT